MTPSERIIIEQLENHHNKLGFKCSEESLNIYLKRQAKQDVKRRISRVFVAVSVKSPDIILGYYTLSTLFIELSHLPEELARKLPRQPVPSALIGRLAVSSEYQGTGIGKLLLIDAIKRTIALSDDIAIYAMIVDAISDNAKQFYEKFGFSKLNVKGERLFLTLKSFR